MVSFEGAKVLITGGSSGIGLALARRLLEAGSSVCIAARDQQKLDAAVASLATVRPGAKVVAVAIDVTDPDSVRTGIATVLERMGGIDVLINNAGYAHPGYVDQLEERHYRAMIEVNYLGAVRVVSALLPHFMAKRSGTIVNVTSMLGFMGIFGYGAYCGSKYALSGYTECLRQDLLPFGIDVHLCYPPTTETPGLATENTIKPKESWAIEGKSRAFTPDQVAQSILQGLRKRRFYIVVGFDSWMVWALQRWFPGVLRGVFDSTLKRYLRENGDGRRQQGAG